MAELVRPMICAVCKQVLDRYEGKWVHAREVIGVSDHTSTPIEYDEVAVRTRCDFCYADVPLAELWIQPAKDFTVPFINSTSVGGWACCEGCAMLLKKAPPDWVGIARRHLASPETSTPDQKMYREFLANLYTTLAENITGPVRPWRAGDEKVMG